MHAPKTCKWRARAQPAAQICRTEENPTTWPAEVIHWRVAAIHGFYQQWTCSLLMPATPWECLHRYRLSTPLRFTLQVTVWREKDIKICRSPSIGRQFNGKLCIIQVKHVYKHLLKHASRKRPADGHEHHASIARIKHRSVLSTYKHST